MAKNSSTAIIGIILVAIILMGPTLLGAFGDLLGKGWAEWQKLWPSYGETNDTINKGEGQAGINLKVFYTDGSIKELSVIPLSFTPLMIPIDPGDGGTSNPISRVEADITMTLQYSGEMNSYDASLFFTVGITDLLGNKVHEFGSETKTMTGTWNSGEAFIYTASGNPKFSIQTIKRTQMQQALSGKTSGRYRLVFYFGIGVTVHFKNGNIDNASTYTTSEYQFEWTEEESKITSLTISVDATPL